MTVFCIRATQSGSLLSANWGRHYCWEFARALSLSPHWDIIDSFSSGASPDRVKGDPFVDGLWGGLDPSTINDNCWVVAQQKSPETGFPAMQVKVQGTGGTAFDDPSGADYGYEGTIRICCVRFAPRGGWDLADVSPDFASPDKVTQNLNMYGNGGDAYRWWFTTGEDYILPVSWRGEAESWKHIPCYIGAYNPMVAEQHTTERPAYWYYGNDSGQVLKPNWQAEAERWFFNTNSYNPTYHYVWCLDENGVMKRWEMMAPPLGEFFRYANKNNEFDSSQGMDLFEVPVYGMQISSDPLSPDWRHIGSHKNAWIGQCLGHVTPLGALEYLPLGGDDHGVVIPWDGTTGFMP